MSTDLYEHKDLASLEPLLTPYLPLSLPLLNVLGCVPPVPIWCTFPPPELPSADRRDWVLLADYGNQIRFFTPAEGSADPQELEEAGGLVVGALRAMLKLAEGRPNIIKFGAYHECWGPILSLSFEFLDKVGTYKTYRPPPGMELDVAPALPEGMTTGPVREGDIDEVLSTSEVAHPPVYLRTRLPHSTALFLTSSSGPPKMVAHCFSHRDGSLGTLFVHPDHRRQGLGKLVALLRAHDSGGRLLAHVSDKNVESRALMRSLGWRGEWYCSWVRVR